MNDITITKNKESATDQSIGADVWYQYDEELKEELTWSTFLAHSEEYLNSEIYRKHGKSTGNMGRSNGAEC